MSGQLSYSYQTPKGVAGGLLDISPYAIDSRINGEEEYGALKFGMGAVQGDNPGVNVLIPSTSSAASDFEGVVLTGFTQMMNTEGAANIAPLQTVGILRWGRAWVRLADGITPVYGESLYLIKTGDDAGLFTNDSGGGANFAVNGRFIGGLGSGDIAPVEIYNQKP